MTLDLNKSGSPLLIKGYFVASLVEYWPIVVLEKKINMCKDSQIDILLWCFGGTAMRLIHEHSSTHDVTKLVESLKGGLGRCGLRI